MGQILDDGPSLPYFPKTAASKVTFEMSGVKEYWLIDPKRQYAEFYQLGKDKLYHTVSLEEGNIFHSAIITGFWFRMDWLWNKPKALDALRELGVS